MASETTGVPAGRHRHGAGPVLAANANLRAALSRLGRR
jgi:hypothetical protein